MKNSSQFINESIFKVNLKYTQMQNKTKELFFKCLNENKPLEYFEIELEKLWGTLDHEFLQNELLEYAELIHQQNIQGRQIKPDLIKTGIITIPIVNALLMEKKFKKVKEREYKISLKSYAYKNDKQEYLKLKVSKYTNQIVPYYYQDTNTIQRYVQLSTYEAMIHNTNLTRAGWNTTLNDADQLGERQFWIPPHNFSCPICSAFQGKILSKQDVMRHIGIEADNASGDLLHPNCKCELTIYTFNTVLQKPSYDEQEIERQYEIRQKVNGLTLKKEEVATDMKIQKQLGNQDQVDELNTQRNAINKAIRELKSALPTAELKKQVVAINR